MENKTEDKILVSYLQIVESLSCEILSCENKIQNLQDITAATYEGIAEKLPKIIERIDSDNEEAGALSKQDCRFLALLVVLWNLMDSLSSAVRKAPGTPARC